MEFETKRARSTSGDRLALLSWVFVLCLAGAACRNQRRPQAPPVEARSSRVDVFVRCTDTSARPIRFRLGAAELRDDTGNLRALEVAGGELESSELERRTPLASAIVPPAHYVALVLRVEGAWLRRPEGLVELDLSAGKDAEVPTEPSASASFEVSLDLRLRERDAASVFLDWRAGDSLVGGLGFQPVLTAALETPQASLGLLYVSDAKNGSVLSIDLGTGEVVGTFKTGAGPSAMTLLRDRRRLFVANGGDGSLSLVDVRVGRAVSNVPLAFGARTSDVVVADPARWVAAANPGLDSVALVTLGAEGGVQNVPVGREPVRLVAAPTRRRLFVVEQGGDSISVIDMSTRAVVAQIAMESRPADADIDQDERELYVGHAMSQNLLVVDTRTLAITDTIFTGGAVTDVLADPRRSRIYIARSRPFEIAVVERRVGAVVLRIPVSGRISSMVLARDGSKLYAAAPDSGMVLVIDVLTGREEPPIRCGAQPTDVVIAE